MSIIDDVRQIDVTFCIVRVFRGADSVRTSRMRNEYDQINLIRAGVSLVERAGETHTVGPGEALYFPAGMERVEWNDPARPLECVTLLFFRQTPLPPLPLYVADASGRLGLMVQWLLEWVNLPERPAALMRNTLTAAILAEYLRLSHLRPTRDVAFRREVTQAIIAGYRRPELRLDDIAAAVGLSREHLVRRFRAAADRTPMAALRDWRLDQATILLQTTDFTVDQIAWRVGIKGQSQLSRQLRRYRQTTASELRLAVLSDR